MKLNIVVMRGVNDEELCDFASMTLKSAYAIRFIEYMPSLRLPGWQEKVMPGAEIIARLTDRYELIPIDKGPYSGPSRDFRIAGAAGSIGIITAVSGHFCSDCNRVRVTAKGTAKGCLFSGEQLDLRPLLASADQEPLEHALKQLVAIKPERHGLSEQSADHEPFVMASIGG